MKKEIEEAEKREQKEGRKSRKDSVTRGWRKFIGCGELELEKA